VYEEPICNICEVRSGVTEPLPLMRTVNVLWPGILIDESMRSAWPFANKLTFAEPPTSVAGVIVAIVLIPVPENVIAVDGSNMGLDEVADKVCALRGNPKQSVTHTPQESMARHKAIPGHKLR
jgi:hypothetical protein